MTPAINLLKKNKVPFEIHQYQHDPKETHYGREAIEKLDPALHIEPQQVYKTLIVMQNGDPHSLAVCVIPVLDHLDLKAVAKALNIKRCEIAAPDIAQKSSGYLVGGISPIGQKKQLKTVIDSQVLQFETVLVSGGRRGLEVQLSPQDLAQVTQAIFEAIAIA